LDVSSLVKAWTGKDHTVVLLKTDSLRVLFRSLSEGNTLPPHKAAGDITVQVLEGQIEFNTADQTMSLHKGQIVALKAAALHSVKALRQSAILITLAAGQRS
jgi:quercetin dioxygenase-like cupin family protein